VVTQHDISQAVFQANTIGLGACAGVTLPASVSAAMVRSPIGAVGGLTAGATGE